MNPTPLPPIAILAGGLATRMRPLTEKIPKALLEVAEKPFIVHQLLLMQRYGLRDIVLCTGYLGAMIEAEIGDGSAYGLRVRYSHDGETLRGTGGAIKQALPLLGQTFFVMYGDSYLEIDYADVAQTFQQSNKRGLMTLYRNENQWDTSNVIFADGMVKRYDKRERTPEMHYIDYGAGMFHADVFDAYPSATPFDLATVYTDLAAAGQLAGYEAPHRFYEIGSHSGLQETDAYLRSKP